jgi:hypothetical protein
MTRSRRCVSSPLFPQAIHLVRPPPHKVIRFADHSKWLCERHPLCPWLPRAFQDDARAGPQVFLVSGPTLAELPHSDWISARGAGPRTVTPPGQGCMNYAWSSRLDAEASDETIGVCARDLFGEHHGRLTMTSRKIEPSSRRSPEWLVTAPHKRSILVDGEPMSIPYGIHHAKRIGEWSTACGLNAIEWVVFWELAFLPAAFRACPQCAALVGPVRR